MLFYILSRYENSYSTSRLKEEIEKNNHTVIIIDHLQCEICIDNELAIIYHGRKLKKPDFIIPRISVSSTSIGSNIIRQYEAKKIPTLVSSSGLMNSRNKLTSLQLLALNNIPLPKTYFASYYSYLQNIQNTLGNPPYVFKLLESTQGLGVFLAKDLHTAQTLISSYYQTKTPFIVQVFIKEAKGTDVRAFVVGGKVVASMKRTAPKGEFRSNIHRGGVGEKAILSAEEEEVVLKAANILNLNIAGVDFLRTRKGPLILEVNSSPGLEGIEKYTGINVANEIILYCEQVYNK